MAPFSDRVLMKVHRRPQSPSRLRSVSTTAVVGVGDNHDSQRESGRRGDSRTQEDRQRRSQSLNINPARGSSDDDAYPSLRVSVPLSGSGNRTTGVRQAAGEAWLQERIASHLSSMRDIENAQNLFRYSSLRNDDVEPSMPSASIRGGTYSDDDIAEYGDSNYIIPSHRERRGSRRPSPNHGDTSAPQPQMYAQDNRGQSASAHRSSNAGEGTFPEIVHPRFGARTPLYVPERPPCPGPGYVDYTDRGAQTEAWPHYHRRNAVVPPDSDNGRPRVPHSHGSQNAVPTSRSSSSRQSRKNSGSGSIGAGSGSGGTYAPPRQPSYRVVITPEYEIDDGINDDAIDDYDTSNHTYHSGNGHSHSHRRLHLRRRRHGDEDERESRQHERELRHSHQRKRAADRERGDDSDLIRHRSRHARYPPRENEERVNSERRQRRRSAYYYDDDDDDDGGGGERRRKSRPGNVFRGNWCLFGRDRRQ